MKRMLRHFIILFSCVLINTIYTNGQGNYNGDYSYNYNSDGETNFITDQIGNGYGSGMATIHLYYEAMCPYCRQFDSMVFKQTVLELSSYLDIHLYPYGNAKTIDNGFGGYEFVSQHGPEETYGNKLHACAIDTLQNITMAVLYNSCLMDDSQAGKGSDDAAADSCGRIWNINSETIKQCAKSDRGSQLLKYYGDESKKVGFKGVPTVLVNGVIIPRDHFKEEVYKALGRAQY